MRTYGELMIGDHAWTFLRDSNRALVGVRLTLGIDFGLSHVSVRGEAPNFDDMTPRVKEFVSTVWRIPGIVFLYVGLAGDVTEITFLTKGSIITCSQANTFLEACENLIGRKFTWPDEALTAA